jgi:hypothetical protein
MWTQSINENPTIPMASYLLSANMLAVRNVCSIKSEKYVLFS